MNIDENVQPYVDCETATKYSAGLKVDLGEYGVEFMQYQSNFFFLMH